MQGDACSLSREAGERQVGGDAGTKMFDLDPGKLIVIGIVALIAIPSKDLPRVMRTIGQFAGRMRRMSAEFQGQFMDAMREMEVADLNKEIEETNKAVMDATKLGGSFDPLTEARKQIASAVEGVTEVQPRHPREASPAPSRRVAVPNDEASSETTPPQDEAAIAASFETPATQAPQGEGVEDSKRAPS